ncbi:hypothetical protein Tco_0390647 [Tanacetum coccineum]
MNQIETVFDIDEETDAFYLQKLWASITNAIQQEAQSTIDRTNSTCRDREEAERRLRADYFDIILYGRVLSHNMFISSNLDSKVRSNE